MKMIMTQKENPFRGFLLFLRLFMRLLRLAPFAILVGAERK